jgi:hypothetical protein
MWRAAASQPVRAEGVDLRPAQVPARVLVADVDTLVVGPNLHLAQPPAEVGDEPPDPNEHGADHESDRERVLDGLTVRSCDVGRQGVAHTGKQERKGSAEPNGDEPQARGPQGLAQRVQPTVPDPS